jgi:enoyl-CoA hydratase/carnithine racemase
MAMSQGLKSQQDSAINLSLRGGLAELVFNRPQTRNALTEAMWTAIPELLATLPAECHALVIRGSGDHFASGADISEFDQIFATAERGQAYSRRIAEALDAIAAVPQPTIAVIRGVCIGGGCGLALACDIRFADTTARFAITPAKMGLLFPFNDTRRLIDIVGLPMARDMLFTARSVAADEAHGRGLIDHLAVPDALDTALSAYLNRLLDLSPHSLKSTKYMLGLAAAGQLADNDETRQIFANAFSSEDFREGYRAFLEKRKPEFKPSIQGQTK